MTVDCFYKQLKGGLIATDKGRVAWYFFVKIEPGRITKGINMPKTKHNPDYSKNKTADVIKHGSERAVPNEHWQVNRDLTPAGESNGWGAFLPRAGKDRPTTHVKTNECDH